MVICIPLSQTMASNEVQDDSLEQYERYFRDAYYPKGKREELIVSTYPHLAKIRKEWGIDLTRSRPLIEMLRTNPNQPISAHTIKILSRYCSRHDTHPMERVIDRLRQNLLISGPDQSNLSKPNSASAKSVV